MATVLESCKTKRDTYVSQITEGCLPLDELLFVQELNYRISVLETFQNFCKTAPVTTDTRVMSFHYQLVDAYTRFLMNERKFGLKTDENGQKKRETAFSALERVIQDTRKRFSMLQRIESALCSCDSAKEINRIEKAIASVNKKKKKLLDMRLEELIDQEAYEEKNSELAERLTYLNDELMEYNNDEARVKNIKKRLADFRKVLENNETLTEFDRTVFESIIDRVIVGGYDDEGNADPSMLTFIYKTGFTNNVDGSKYKPPRKNSKGKKDVDNASEDKLCSFSTNDNNKLCSYNSDDTCGDGCFVVQTKNESAY